MLDATFTPPDLTTFARLDEVGLIVSGQRLEPERAVLSCRVARPDPWCQECGCAGLVRDTVTRELAHEPFGWRPTVLVVRLRRYRCTGCSRVWREDLTAAAEPRSRLSRRALRWALEALVVGHLSISRIAAALGVDEHVWRHTRRGDKYVTVIIDLTPIRDGTGPSRLLDMVEGRSKQVFKTWLADRPTTWREAVEVVAMDGFTGFKTAAAEELPTARAVMDPFHVVRLGGDALDRCRRRVQQDLHGHRGRRDDPLYRARRTLHTGAGLLTDKQRARIAALFAGDEHVQVEATWGIYQRMIAAYREPDRAAGKTMMQAVIDSVSTGVPAALSEVITLGRTLKKRAADVLAYFDRPGTSNGPTEAINGRLEHLRGSALGFRNLTNYIARSLLEAGGFRPQLHPQIG